jgi:hypothetical protein
MSSAIVETATVETEVTVEETEAYHELMSRAGRRTGNIPADLVVRHVMACVPAHERQRARTACASRRARRMAAISGSMSPVAPARARGLIARS